MLPEFLDWDVFGSSDEFDRCREDVLKHEVYGICVWSFFIRSQQEIVANGSSKQGYLMRSDQMLGDVEIGHLVDVIIA